MKSRINKYTRFVAILMVAFLVIPVFALTKQDISFPVAEKIELTDQDIKTAGEIANMTGVDIEEIKKLREYNLDWNTILKRVKDSETEDTTLLYNENKDFISMGFTEEEISDVKLMINRVIYQLEELTDSIEDTVITETEIKVPDILNNQDEDDLSDYKKLLESISIDKAIEAVLKLYKDMGNIEDAINEYLYALQIEIDIDMYFEDTNLYEEQKQQKELMVVGKEIITINLIEEKVLIKLQKQNEKDIDRLNIDSSIKPLSKEVEISDNEVLIPVPTVESIKPTNPKDEILQEIQIIDPMNEDGI